MYTQPVIFVVDDDEDDLFFIKSAILNNISGSIVRCFINGKQLIDSLGEWKDNLPAFILLDLNMPILNGKDTLKYLRKIAEFSNLPVIIFSTSNNPAEKALCNQFGANDYLCKPTSMSVYDDIMLKLKKEYVQKIAVSQ